MPRSWLERIVKTPLETERGFLSINSNFWILLDLWVLLMIKKALSSYRLSTILIIWEATSSTRQWSEICESFTARISTRLHLTLKESGIEQNTTIYIVSDSTWSQGSLILLNWTLTNNKMEYYNANSKTLYFWLAVWYTLRTCSQPSSATRIIERSKPKPSSKLLWDEQKWISI